MVFAARSRPGTGASRRDVLLAGFGGVCLCCMPTLGRCDDLTIREVAPGVFMRQGVTQDATAGNLDAIANIGFIVGNESVLVTDSGGSLADGQWLRAQIKARTDKLIRYVVISHVHPDHAFGAGAFSEDRPVIIGHAKLPEALQQRGEYYKKGLADIIGADKVGAVVMPTRTVSRTDSVDLGGRVVTFQAHGPAHTSCDLSMVDSGSGLLLPADLLFVGRTPSLDGSLIGWLKELDALAAMPAGTVVPGHGPTLVSKHAAIEPLHAYLVALRDGVRAEIKRSGTIDEAVQTVARDQRDRWALFDDYNGRNVTEAYKELEWE